jgi:hypothetical protein
MRTIDRVKKKFAEEDLEAVLERKPTARVYEKKMDGDTEAKLISLCCSEPPRGFAKPLSQRRQKDFGIDLNLYIRQKMAVG